MESGAALQNALVSVALNRLGEVTSYRTENGREYADAPMNRLKLYKDVPRLFDAWDIDSHYRDQPVALALGTRLSRLCAAKGLPLP